MLSAARTLPQRAVRRYTVVASAAAAAAPTATLAVRVHGGARYADKDGLAHLLSRFNFQSTGDKSALRLVRESELLGGALRSSVDREYITLQATFLKESLPYYVNAIASVLYKTSFKPHELVESVGPAAAYDLAVATSDPVKVAEDALYAATYRSAGLGRPVLFDGVEQVTLDDIKQYANKVYTQENIEIFATGVEERDLKRFVGESLINTLPKGSAIKEAAAPKAFAGEVRIRAHGPNVAAVAIPAESAAQIPELQVLKAYLASPLYANADAIERVAFDSFSGTHGLLSLYVKGANASAVSANIKKVVADLKAGLDIAPAKELAQVDAALAAQQSAVPVEQLALDKVAKFKLGKFAYSAVGDVTQLPYRDEL